MDESKIPDLTRLLYQYGPFAFALLFTVYLSKWAHNIYSTACSRKDPRPTKSEKATYCAVFLAIVVFGMGLVSFSVYWWWNYRPAIHVFRGEIMALEEYARVTSKDLYFRPRILAKVIDNAPALRDEEFVAISDTPFREGQMFTLIYGKQGREEHDTLEIVYSDRQQPVKYRVEWEDERGCNVLKEKGRQQSQSELKAMEVSILALAAATPVWAGTAKTLPLSKTLETFPPPQPNKDVTQDFIISDLQNERSSVGTKIKALDALANWPDDDIRRLASKITPKEPMLATLIDLGRHSDKELASKARRVTARVDIEKLLERSLRSDEQLQVKGALTTLQRIEKNQALQILERADAKKSPSLKAFSEQIQSGKATQLLRPVGSAGGDRYYVKAEWNPQDSSAVECLTELFNRRLLARRSLEEEREFMEKRQERYVYWYDKDWALDMAMEIERCGGTASFVAP